MEKKPFIALVTAQLVSKFSFKNIGLQPFEKADLFFSSLGCFNVITRR